MDWNLVRLVMLVAAFALLIPGAASAEKKSEEGEEEAPQLKFLELHGYFRVRSDLFYNMDLGTFNPLDGSTTSRILPPISGRVGGDGKTTPKVKPMSGNTLAGANMRFRLEPTLNISDEIKLNAQIDMLDNLVLGSTPEAFTGQAGFNDSYPMPVFSQSQIAPHQGKNSYTDSITLKRVWAEVMTPFGQLRFGRMPSHWGMGVLVNDGSCLECDGGANADRIMFLTKVMKHYLIAAMDFQSEGVTNKQMVNGYPTDTATQPIDADQRDDVQQYVLAVARRDSPAEIKESLENNRTVINYGVYNVLRLQSYDFPNYYNSAPASSPEKAQDLAKRDVKLYIGSPWFKLIHKKLHVEFEFDFIIGKMANAMTKGPDLFYPDPGTTTPDATYQDITIWQWGGVVQADYKFLHDKLKLGVEAGVASGDDHPGWGLRPVEGTVGAGDDPTKPDKTYGYGVTPFGPRQFGDYYLRDGTLVKDRNITNFRFNTDYRIDMILWREVLGQLTDAWYVKPSISYLIAEGFGVGMDAIVQAIFAESSPGQDKPLGLEFDFHIFYLSEDGFMAGVDYGVLIPFGGMDNLGANYIRNAADTGVNADLATSSAQRIHAYLGVKF